MLSSRQASVASREGEEGDDDIEVVGIGMQGYAVPIADGRVELVKKLVCDGVTGREVRRTDG